jgi:LmbE family N-acetylglucosaminyl deacetylase
MGNNILVIAAHPDDELLGCGGTIAKHIRNGDNVCFVIVCEGSSHRGVDQEDNEQHHALLAAKILGVQDVKMLGFPDQKLDTYTLTEIITPLEEIVNSFRPSIVYCQYGGDINRDHELLFKAIMVAVRPTVEFIDSVYAFDTASSTEWAYPRSFTPDTWVDINDTLELKLEAMSCYKSELCDYPHPRSLKGLENKAKAWGNQACMEAAEVFMTIRRSLRNDKTPV